uniref:ARAD1D14674p n=1 Tax=Blastobotrys adeninivorans TaxID=409370 RepID=A0A060T9V1_BLAAD
MYPRSIPHAANSAYWAHNLRGIQGYPGVKLFVYPELWALTIQPKQLFHQKKAVLGLFWVRLTSSTFLVSVGSAFFSRLLSFQVLHFLRCLAGSSHTCNGGACFGQPTGRSYIVGWVEVG